MSAVIGMPTSAVWTDCRLCGSRLFYNRRTGAHVDDMNRGVCAECHGRPEARRLLGPAPATVGQRPSAPTGPQPFPAWAKSLIKSTHGYMAAAQLLDILNQRHLANPGTVAFTMEQLHAEVQTLVDPAAGGDWAGLRDIITRARRCGLLEEVTPQMIDDFAVVFMLSPAQHMHLRDVIRNAKEIR